MAAVTAIATLIPLFAVLTASSVPLASLTVEVEIGRMVDVNPREKVFRDWATMGHMCKVEVVHEPITQAVGHWEPQVFDCDFKFHTVRYTHYGSTLLDRDTVKLHVYRMTNNDTMGLIVTVNIRILHKPYEIGIVHRHLMTADLYGISESITEDVLDFSPRFLTSDTCHVEFFPYMYPQLPAYGVLVQGTGNSAALVVDGIKRGCQEFQNMGLRYRHMDGTLNTDYIQLLLVASRQDFNHGVPWREWVQIKVVIDQAKPNSPPRISPGSTLSMAADQYALTAVTPAMFSADDSETHSSDLVVNISKPLSPGQGAIVYVDDPARSISSFRQHDINDARIAFRSPYGSLDARATFTVELTVLDHEWAGSSPIQLTITLRSSNTKAPRIFTHNSLTLLKGQSRTIQEKHLKIVDTDNLSSVRVFITSGPAHGTVRVNGSASMTFTPSDISQGLVTYSHDGSFGLTDSIYLRVTDNTYESSIQLVIGILPVDDTPPTLLVNVGLQVSEAGIVQITPDFLVAVDDSSSPERIHFIVVRPPLLGEIQKRLPWQRYGSRIWNFTQDDITQGLIYYAHNGQEAFFDTFNIYVKDGEATPNQSPIHTVMVTVIPVDDSLPRLVPVSTLALTVKETNIGYFTRDIVSYTDEDSLELTYVLQSPPRKVGSSQMTTDGKIVSIEGQFEPRKDTNLPEVLNFTQRQIDHLQIVYVPPEEDIGADMINVEFVFAVMDEKGNVAPPQTFRITIIPVNDKCPSLVASTLLCDEGGSSVLTTKDFSLTDVDTALQDIELEVMRTPAFGNITMGNRTMRRGETFRWNDIEKEIIQYIHNGAEENYDVFILMAWDGKQGVPTNVDIRVELKDDEDIPVLEGSESSALTVLEGGEVVISTEVLPSSSLNLEHETLVFSVVQFPHEGELLIDETPGTSFTQADVTEGKVKYRHNGKEVGLGLVTDGIRFEIKDSRSRKPTFGRSYVTIDVPATFYLNVTILPTDNAPPKMRVLGKLEVAEGQTAVLGPHLLAVMDEDSPVDDLKMVLKTAPSWGYVENLTPLLGSEELRAGVAVSEWPVADFNGGNVRYVQREHRFTEPKQDSFTVFVTDGVLLSAEVTVSVNILPQNDEQPKVTVANFTIREGEPKVLDGKILRIEDLDSPADDVTLSLLHPPQNGKIIHLKRGIGYSRPREIPFHSMPWTEFNQNLVYKHDGSEHSTDSFVIRVSDGVHTTDREIFISVQRINIHKPILVRNLGLPNVEPNSSTRITDSVLKATDQDTADSGIHFQVHELPSKGELNARSSSNSEWSRIELGTTFTQEHVDLHLVRYTHWGLTNGTGRDHFKFTVSDLIYENGQLLHFEITIKDVNEAQRRNPNLVVTAHAIEVTTREKYQLSERVLNAEDGLNQPDKIRFKPISYSQHGHLRLNNQIILPEAPFTMKDILAGKVSYESTSTDPGPLDDSIQLSVSNNFVTKNITLHVRLHESQPPMPLITSTGTIRVPEDGDITISSQELHSSDNNTLYVVSQSPTFGVLWVNGQKIRADNAVFSEEHVRQQRVSYVRNPHSGLAEDSFEFQVSDIQGAVLAYWENGKRTKGPTRVSVTVIQNAKESLPQIDIDSEHLEDFGRGRRGFIFAFKGSTSHHARSEALPETVYSLVKVPEHGFLENVNFRQPMVENDAFSAHDITRKSIRYVVNSHESDVAEDEFQLMVEQDGKVLQTQRIGIKWPVISFTNSQFVVCEDSEAVSVNLRRIGKTTDSSYVSLQTISSSARENSDFIVGSNPQIQFDPGQSTATKIIKIVKDNAEELEREIFYLRLRDPVNTVIGRNSKAVVTIVDSKRGICSRFDNRFTTTEAPTSTDYPLSTVLVRTSLNVTDSSNKSINSKNIIYPSEVAPTATPNTPPACRPQTQGLLFMINETRTLLKCENGQWKPVVPSRAPLPSPPSQTTHSTAETTKPSPTVGPTLMAREHDGDTFPEPTQNTDNSAERTCDHGWEEYEGQCYSWFSRRLTWSAAAAFCSNRYGAHLTEIRDSTHNRWLFQLTDGATFWIGLQLDESAESTWVFLNGDSKFANWKKGFPRMKGKRGKGHKCAAATPPRAQWANKSCDDDMHTFICSRS